MNRDAVGGKDLQERVHALSYFTQEVKQDSVIVLNNSLYHNSVVEKVPT